MRYFLGIILFLVTSSALAIDAENLWRSYRATEPLFDQNIVVVQPSDASRQHIIVTEPPAQIFIDRDQIFAEVFGEDLRQLNVFKHKIGVDGWVKDIVLTLSPQTEFDLNSAVARMSALFYGTNYKASYRSFRFGSWQALLKPRARVGAQNIEVSAASLNLWLFEDPLLFNPLPSQDKGVTGGHSRPLSELLSARSTGVYLSKRRGLAVIILDRQVALNHQRGDLRRFVLETDMLLGAVAPRDSESRFIALIGRERETPLTNAPPLRLDTILTLSAAKTKNLAQSYERNAPFAGRIESKQLTDNFEFLRAPDADRNVFVRKLVGAFGVDWAPILLSQELTHTEYGQILNVTDQMLKSWSMGGDIAYANFPYRAPPRFPDRNGVKQALVNEIGNFSSLTFNWNTAGASSWAVFEDYEILAMKRTGSLPVSYFPDQIVDGENPKSEQAFVSAEDRYWEFFANLTDPLLSRVAQYAMLHQVFVSRPITANRTEPMVPIQAYNARWIKLAAQTKEALLQFAGGSDPSPEAASEGCSPDVRDIELDGADRRRASSIIEQYQGKKRDQLIQAIVDPNALDTTLASELRDKAKGLQRRIKQFNASVNAFNRDQRECKSEISQSSNSLPSCFGRLKEEKNRLEKKQDWIKFLSREFESLEEERSVIFQSAAQLTRNPSYRIAIMKFGSCTAALEAVKDQLPPAHNSVYKTPSVVVSVPKIDWTGVGGHNLDGRSAKVIPDASVARGEFKIDHSEDVIRLNPNEMGRSTEFARAFERLRRKYISGDPSYRRNADRRLRAVLERETSPQVVFSSAAIKSNKADEPVRGLAALDNPNRSFVGQRWVPLKPNEISEWLAEAKSLSADFVVDRKGNVYNIFHPKWVPPQVLQVKGPFEYSRALAQNVTDIARAGQGGEQGIVIAGRQGVTAADLLVESHVQATKQSLLEAGAAGGGIKPPNARSLLSMFFPERGRGGGNFGRRNLKVDGFSGNRPGLFKRVRRLLSRTDADWSSAEIIDPVRIGDRVVVGRIAVTLKETGSPLEIRLKSFFKSRDTTAADLDTLKNIARTTLDELPDGSPVFEAVLRVRNSYLDTMEALKTDVRLRQELSESNDDFGIVELVNPMVGWRRG